VDQVVPFDLHRMFLGDEPPLFFLEIVFRCLVIYGWTLLLLRWVGGRSVTQLSLVEFLLVIALGSAVGDALFYPEVPLLAAMLVILVVVLINKAMDEAILRWDWAKRIIDGGPERLLSGGRILTDSLNRRKIGMAELAGALRNAGIRNLGEVDAVYMEASGKLSIFRRRSPTPGLPIAPPFELVPPELAGEIDPDDLCCQSCGVVVARDAAGPDTPCPECGQARWTRPVQPPA
jgi:uncharacterized membrane protein YcaP (DUF421 family)